MNKMFVCEKFRKSVLIAEHVRYRPDYMRIREGCDFAYFRR